MTKLPDALVAALRASAPSEDSEQETVWSAHVRRGDLRYVRALDRGRIEPRLVLVRDVDGTGEYAEVLLAHPYPELACEVDAVIDRAASGAPFRIVVETDLRGVVWTYQFGSAVGRLSADDLREVGRVIDENDVEGGRGVHCGLRLAGIVDPRWEFKSDEGDALRLLTGDCSEALLDGRSWVVDPGLLQPDLLATADDPETLVAELAHWARTRTVEVGLDDVEWLLERGALEVDLWAAMGGVGLDAWTAIQTAIEQLVTAPSSRPADEPLSVLTGGHGTEHVWAQEPEAVHVLGQKELAAT